jgi:hypothetical protein
MKALGLSFSLFVFASLAAPPAEAHFRAVFHPSSRMGPMHGGEFRDEFGRQRGRSDGGLGFVPLDAGSEAAPPQYVPVPVPVPYGVGRGAPSQPRLILIGEQPRSHGPMPTVVYGDPPPAETRP